jgi:uncharacterized protein YbjT (DUF2867 family)
MPKKISVLVTGATGQQGGAVARRLIQLGHQIHAFTRKPQSEAAQRLAAAGANITIGDFDDPAAVTDAMKRVDAVFALSTPYEAGPDREIRQGIALVDAAKAAGVRHLVYTSVASVGKTGIPHFDSKAVVERHLQASGVPYTIIAPVFFMANLENPQVTRGGNLTLALPPDRRLQVVALEDIGALVALAIDQPQRVLGQRIEVASDELTPAQMAETIGRVTGRSVGFVEFPLAQLRAISEEMAIMFEWFDRVGYSVDLERLRREYPEIAWTSFESWAKKRAWDHLLMSPEAHP